MFNTIELQGAFPLTFSLCCFLFAAMIRFSIKQIQFFNAEKKPLSLNDQNTNERIQVYVIKLLLSEPFAIFLICLFLRYTEKKKQVKILEKLNNLENHADNHAC